MRIDVKSALFLVFLAACNGGDDEGKDGETDADTDATDTDDTDAGDTDGPADTDDTDEPTEPGVDADQDGSPAGADCDDSDPAVYPGAPELCDGVVVDCLRKSDDGLVTVDGAVTFDDLEDALDAAVDGSTLLLCPGTYTGAFEAEVPVRIDSLDGRAATFLQGDGDSVLALPGGSEVAGVTIRGGDAAEGGGIRMTSSGTLLLEHSLIELNHAVTGGGLSVAADSHATLVDTVIGENTAIGGGGAVVAPGGTLELTVDSLVAGNEAEAWGGGVWLDGGSLLGGTVSGNVIYSYAYPHYYYDGKPIPDGVVYGGAGVAASGESTVTGVEILASTGIYGAGLSVSGGTTTLSDTHVHHNVAYQLGGGAAVWAGTLVLVDGSRISDNEGGEAGGGIVVVEGAIVGGEIADNVGGERGGGVLAFTSSLTDVTLSGNRADSGAGLYAVGPVSVTGGTITANDAARGGGVAMGDGFGGYFPDPDELVLTGVAVVGNDANQGGGLLLGAGTATVAGGSFTENTAKTGGAARVEGGALMVSGVDLGEGGSDNAPADLWTSAGTFSFGVDAWTVCDGDGCTP